MKPWMWEEIAVLRGRARTAFLRMYGDRGWVAMIAAAHLHGDEWNTVCATRPCATCPLQVWAMANPTMTCFEVAMPVYTRLIAERGRMPKEKRR